MKRVFRTRTPSVIAVFLFSLPIVPVSADDLEAAFRNPPAETGAWWFRHNTINREAMTRDLEAMKRAAIRDGRCRLFTLSTATAKLKFQSMEGPP